MNNKHDRTNATNKATLTAAALLSRMRYTSELVEWAMMHYHFADGNSDEAFCEPLRRIGGFADDAMAMLADAETNAREIDACLVNAKKEAEVLSWAFRGFFSTGNDVGYEALNAGLATIIDLADAVSMDLGRDDERDGTSCLSYTPTMPMPFTDAMMWTVPAGTTRKVA